MIEIRIKGGLGNQLFQYAVGYAMTKRLHTDLVQDISFFPRQTLRGYKLKSLKTDFTKTENVSSSMKAELVKNKYLNKYLRIRDHEVISLGQNKKYILETKSDMIGAIQSEKCKNLYIDGYYQSEKYFKTYRNELLRQYVPRYEAEEGYTDTLRKIETCNSVAVHVRRGDFLKAQNDPNPNHYLLSALYYHNALDYSNTHISNPTYFWFSDDINWVKQNFGLHDNFNFVSLHTSHADIDEMMLMKNCRHIITANSTFSWWAAWLNENEDGIRICPAKRYGNKEMIPESWIKVEG